LNSIEIILIVDDDNILIEYLTEILNNIKFDLTSIMVAHDSNGALTIIQKNEVDLIFLDMILPNGKRGIDIYQEIREISDAHIIFMSGHPLPELSDDKKTYFLHKPFTYDDVEEILTKLNK